MSVYTRVCVFVCVWVCICIDNLIFAMEFFVPRCGILGFEPSWYLWLRSSFVMTAHSVGYTTSIFQVHGNLVKPGFRIDCCNIFSRSCCLYDISC